MQKMATTHSSDPFWRNVGLILSQYFGLVDGYHHVAPKDMVCFTITDCMPGVVRKRFGALKNPCVKISEQSG